MEPPGKQQFLIEILSDNNLLSRGIIDLSDTICNAETLARLYMEKLLSAATYYSNSGKNNEPGKVAPDFSLADLGYKEGLKYLCISFTKDGDNANETAKTYKELVGQYMSYSVPAYVPTVLLFLCIATYKPMPEEVCFAQIGCLDLGGPWTERPIVFNYVPQSPAAINTTFILTSRDVPDGYKFPATLKDPNISAFDWSKKLNIIIHGFTDNSTRWVQSLASSFLASEDLNVLALDWSTGADMYYPQSVANSRVVATQVSAFLEYLTETKRKKLGDIHIIGHSLGAHVAGYIGKRNRIARITALDPAAPLFEGFHPDVRLNDKDAKEVVVLHTNVSPLGFGIKDPMGTVDIYVNDAQDQFGCIPMMEMLFAVPTMERLQSMRHNIACSHRRAYELYSEVVFSRHPLKAYPCPFSVIQSEEKETCVSLCEESSTCLSISKSPVISSEHKVFYLPTHQRQPFCITYVNVEAKSCSSQKPILQLRLNASFDSSYVPMHNGALTENQRIHELIPVKCGLLHVSSIRLKLSVDAKGSFMTHPEACFSYFQLSYVDHNDDLIILRHEDIKIRTGESTLIEFSNNMFSLFSYRDSVLEYINKMNVVIPFYNSVDIKKFFTEYVRLPEVLK